MIAGLRLAAMSIAVVLSVSQAFASTALPVSPEVYGALPAVADMEISPGGRFLASIRHDDKGALIAFQDLEARATPATAIRIESIKPRSLTWANDDTVLVLASQTVRRVTNTGRQAMEAWRWLAISRQDLKSRVLLDYEPGYYVLSPGVLLSTAQGQSDRVVFSRWTSRRTVQDRSTTGTRIESRQPGGGVSLFSYRLEEGSEELVAVGNGDTTHWIVDESGVPLFRVDRDGSGVHIHARAEGGGLSLRSTAPGRGDAVPSLQGRAPDGNMLALVERDGRRAVAEFDVDAGAPGEIVFAHASYDVDAALYDPRTARIRGIGYTDDLPRRHYLDPLEQRVHGSLAMALPDASPILWSRSADGSRYVVKVAYVDHPPQWFLYDTAAKTLDVVAPTYASLDGQVHASKEKYDYAASDGLHIPGYLTVPAGVDKRMMPLIVLPHGGPNARDDQSFDFWPFFYAARGYLVYQPNFRGSSGYGKTFLQAGDGQWGRRMQDDISEGVHKLIAEGVVDPSRICIVGASYGGYAALVGASRTPDLYSCAVSVAGISNVSSLVDPDDPESVAYWESRIGDRHDRETLRSISPLFHANSVRAPILLIHGKDDTVVKVSQSRVMAKALREAGKRVELVELAGEDHWLSAAETRTAMLARSIDFIDLHIGTGGD